MIIKEITNYEEWTSFFNACGSPSFHHSWEWGDLQKLQGYDSNRLGLYDGNKLIAIIFVIKLRAKRGHFLFIPHGPIFINDEARTNHFSFIMDYLKDVANKESFSYIRVAPTLANTAENEHFFAQLGFRKAPIYMHAEIMWVIDLSQTEDEILANMRKTTRYLVKKAIKDGVTVEQRTDEKAVDEFWNIYKETFTRENFSPFSKKFLSQEFETFHQSNNAIFFLGKVNSSEQNVTEDKTEPSNSTKNGDTQKFDQEGPSKFLAGSLILFTESTAFYHQGASVHSKIPVPYLVQWEGIKEAKRRGCKYYNFYGIMKSGRTPKAWAGLSLFKQGFGGFEIDYLPTQDYIISPKYWISFAIDKYQAFKRGI